MNAEPILREFYAREPRPLPVILLLDASGSMGANGKMASLNRAVEEMLDTFADEEVARASICVVAIVFGGDVRVHLPMSKAKQARGVWESLSAGGGTPLGACLSWLLRILEDKETIPSRSYRPTVVLVSDGHPTDEWLAPLRLMEKSTRGEKMERMAMAIGSDANMEVLQRFLNDPESQVFRAHEAREIHKFFQWVTLSVTACARGMNLNQLERGN